MKLRKHRDSDALRVEFGKKSCHVSGSRIESRPGTIHSLLIMCGILALLGAKGDAAAVRKHIVDLSSRSVVLSPD